ncbi:MAG: hypothetical protein HUU08_09175 [Candidatus Brocadia sp.]|nr:hypothetical protein [Candidatus Brocadia sp.]
MTNILEIDTEIYNAFVESFGEDVLKEKTDDILLSSIENRLEQYTREILKYEEKYSVSFKEFEEMWDEGRIKDRHGHETESDFIDWEMLEMLEMEKKELLFTRRKP